MRPHLIGTGFYSDSENNQEKQKFFMRWLQNTGSLENIVVVDNSQQGLHPSFLPFVRQIRVYKNLGHAGDSSSLKSGRLLGWSMSWIQSALVAYSEGCDFIYKEQDCLAFGKWMPEIKHGRMAFGRNSQMPCEQSLFYIEHSFILPVVRDYIALEGHDCNISPEDKFGKLMGDYGSEIQFHNLPGGRDRPIPDLTKPFYLQRITDDEMKVLFDAKLI
jgi:hypothetical protein